MLCMFMLVVSRCMSCICGIKWRDNMAWVHQQHSSSVLPNWQSCSCQETVHCQCMCCLMRPSKPMCLYCPSCTNLCTRIRCTCSKVLPMDDSVQPSGCSCGWNVRGPLVWLDMHASSAMLKGGGGGWQGGSASKQFSWAAVLCGCACGVLLFVPKGGSSRLLLLTERVQTGSLTGCCTLLRRPTCFF
jgi:hypothetical protein